jgi:hypothetical protein
LTGGREDERATERRGRPSFPFPATDWEAKLAPFVKLALVKVFKEERRSPRWGCVQVECS